MGADSFVHPTAVLFPGVVLGSRVRVEAHAVIGGDGFGWVKGPAGLRAMPHRGGVVVGDDVFIGAGTTVHQGVLTATRIGRRSKLDAQVHVGHNGEIGDDCLLAAQVGLAGSVRLGHRVQVGGQAGFADHVSVGDDARVAAKCGVIGDVAAGATVGGYPARDRASWLRSVATLRSLARRRAGGAP